ncbi:MAG: CRISPR-associated endonuclease Cas2 [Gammaproteobacteria bacterium]|jgi:CRISPR-associated protein Cas2|nr:CRISPR-associated endonuclease Cas2 [Gammaproteobacteria bacterium]
MALNLVRLWLVAYDIADSRRLQRVHRYLKTEGMPVQYSVFLVETSPARMGRIRIGLAALVNPRRDDVRIYPIPMDLDIVSLGRSTWPAGMQLLGPTTPFTNAVLSATVEAAACLDGKTQLGE